MDLAVSLNPTLFIQFTDDAVDMTSVCLDKNTIRDSDMLDYPYSNSGYNSYHLILSPCGSQFVISKGSKLELFFKLNEYLLYIDYVQSNFTKNETRD